ncbi:s-phase kinase-associated protein [Anaeramoeba ignava]|uniref:Elongin-C n=1 Tax=Anaeramoeba ignava TaxID=1746090 RepID=A0A9Q0RG09_ANAIG|nr:s-phase kinase-associated protein [Anaeramoeba ignava]
MSVKLISSTGEEFEVEKEIAMMSQTIKNMIETTADDAPVPIPTVKSEILQKVIEFCRYHYEHPSPQKDIDKEKESEKRSDDIEPWDRTFCDVEQPVLFELILAANFLDIKSLLDVTL